MSVLPQRNIRLTLAYDGTDFFGWQVQKEGRTVQGVLEQALARMHGHPVHLQGAGRTDTGVHACGQVANFFTDLDSIPPERFRDAFNSYLPHDVRVLHSAAVPESFNAKSCALMRVYAYNLYVAPVVLPQYRRYCWRMRRAPDVALLNRLAAQLVGTHNFTSFAAAGDVTKSRVRRVAAASFYPQGPFLVFRISASSFLWKMVRIMLGTMVELEQEGSGPERLAEILRLQDRKIAGSTAPARGLFLERIIYDEENPGPF